MQLKYSPKSPAMLTSTTPRSQPPLRSHPRSLPRSQVSLPRSQALTERERRLTFKLTSIAGSETPRFGIKRSNTMLERPEQVYKPRKWYSESVTVDYIRHLRHWNKETEAKLKETMHVLSMQRSKSDLDVRPPETQVGGPLFGAGLIRERSQIILGNVSEAARRESVGQSNKQEVKISKAVVPRKGLIQLSTDDHAGFGITGMGEKQGPGPHDLPPAGGKTTSLIKRKDILDQIRQGNKLLEEYEEQKQKEEEMTKSLGEYTMLDLQSRILEMTDAKSVKQRTSGMLDSPVPPGAPPSKQKPPGKKDKQGITLPAIKQLNPFGL